MHLFNISHNTMTLIIRDDGDHSDHIHQFSNPLYGRIINRLSRLIRSYIALIKAYQLRWLLAFDNGCKIFIWVNHTTPPLRLTT